MSPRFVRVAGAAVRTRPMDWGGNAAGHRRALAAAREAGAAVVCLPELGLSGYGCEDSFGSMDLLRRSERSLRELLPHTTALIAAFGLPVLHRGALYDAAVLVRDGRILGVVGKQHLAGDGLHYEPRWFRPWPEGAVSEIELAGQRVPLGDLVFDVGGLRIGFEICEDAWVADRSGASLARRGVDLVLNPSASHFAFGKADVRRRLVAEGSRAFGAGYVYSSLVGNEAGRAIYDGHLLVAASGEVLVERRTSPTFEEGLVWADLDLDALRMRRARQASFEVEPADGPGTVLDPAPLPASAVTTAEAGQGPDEGVAPDGPEEEFCVAVTTGLRDYLLATRAQGFVVSLSGGADSAAVACLAAFAARLARPDDPNAVRALLTTVYQPSANSSETSREAAAAVANALGADHLEIDIEPMAAAYRDAVANAIGRPLDWDRDDIALQNIQARARGPGVWMIANLRNQLLLATSNRSEAAVGYATMDGDTCGGLSPIAGIDKAFLLDWLIWLRDRGLPSLGPVPALEVITRRTPTAELRPLDSGQTDEDDLMPYPVLDAIESSAIRDKLPPVTVWRTLCADRPDLPPAHLAVWTERFFVLWSRNQWKRERYAPSFHLDDESLDPKTWCRFPILSGGYADELAELRAAAAALAGAPS